MHTIEFDFKNSASVKNEKKNEKLQQQYGHAYLFVLAYMTKTVESACGWPAL